MTNRELIAKLRRRALGAEVLIEGVGSVVGLTQNPDGSLTLFGDDPDDNDDWESFDHGDYS